MVWVVLARFSALPLTEPPPDPDPPQLTCVPDLFVGVSPPDPPDPPDSSPSLWQPVTSAPCSRFQSCSFLHLEPCSSLVLVSASTLLASAAEEDDFCGVELSSDTPLLLHRWLGSCLIHSLHFPSCPPCPISSSFCLCSTPTRRPCWISLKLQLEPPFVFLQHYGMKGLTSGFLWNLVDSADSSGIVTLTLGSRLVQVPRFEAFELIPSINYHVLGLLDFDFGKPLPPYEVFLPHCEDHLPLHEEHLPLYEDSLPLYEDSLPLYEDSLPLYEDLVTLTLYEDHVTLPLYEDLDTLPFYEVFVILPLYEDLGSFMEFVTPLSAPFVLNVCVARNVIKGSFDRCLIASVAILEIGNCALVAVPISGVRSSTPDFILLNNSIVEEIRGLLQDFYLFKCYVVIIHLCFSAYSAVVFEFYALMAMLFENIYSFYGA